MRIEVEMIPIIDEKVNKNGCAFMPFDSNKYLQGAVYDAFAKKFGREKTQKLHDAYTVKPFSFTWLLARNRKVTPEGLFVRGPVRFMFSTIYDELGEAVIDYFEPDREVSIIPNKYRVVRARIFEEPKFKNAVTFRTVTPFIVVDKKKNYTLEDEGFIKALWNNIELKTSLYGGRIDRIKFLELKSKRITWKGKTYYGYNATVNVFGDEKGLEVLYHAGFGAKGSSGFGFVKII